VTTYPCDQSVCRSSINSSLKSRGYFDLRRELKQAAVKDQYSSLSTGEISPAFRGEVAVFYADNKGSTSFAAGCFVREGGKLEQVFGEGDTDDVKDPYDVIFRNHVDGHPQVKADCVPWAIDPEARL
jgi:hypothetical protein